MTDENKLRRITYLLVLALMVLLPMNVTAYKLYVLNYPLAGLIPAPSYKVELNMQVEGHGEDIAIHTYLPKTDSRQTIDNEQNSAGIFLSDVKTDPLNREITWKAQNVRGQQGVSYSYSVRA
jgi:hypothetical protein